MPDDLQTIYGELAAKVPTEPEAEFDFTEDMLPVPPARLGSDKLFIERHVKRYGGYYAVDSLWFHAYHQIYRQLALLILAAVFHDNQAPIRLDLAHPASDIKHLMLDYNYKNFDWRGYYTQPYLVRYHASGYDYGEVINRLGGNLNMEDTLSFRLTNLDDSVYTEDEYQQRDTIWLNGNDRAHILFAEFLLDAGRSEERHGIYSIEGSGGTGAFLGLWSAEVEFVLPGSHFWHKDQWLTVNENQS